MVQLWAHRKTKLASKIKGFASTLQNTRLTLPTLTTMVFEAGEFSNAGRWPAWRRIEKICVS